MLRSVTHGLYALTYIGLIDTAPASTHDRIAERAGTRGNGESPMLGTLCRAVLVIGVVVGVTVPAEASTPTITPTRLPYPVGGTSVIGAGVDQANQNAQLAETVSATLRPGWSAQPPMCPQSGESAPDSISVSGVHTVVIDRQFECSYITDYDTATGVVRWRKLIQGYAARAARVIGTVVYVEADSADGTRVFAYDLSTGSQKFATFDSDDYSTGNFSVDADVVSAQDWVDSATTGARRFTFTAKSSTDGATLLAGGRVIYNSDGGVQANSASTGALVWTYTKSNDPEGPGSGNAVPALHNGLLYVRSYYGETRSTTLVLDPATGHLVRVLPVSDTPIAFDGNVGIFTITPLNSVSAISAVDLTTGRVYWSHSLPRVAVDKFGTTIPTVITGAPIVENGLVWILDATDSAHPAHVAALDEVTGATKSITVTRCNASADAFAFAIAEHRIFAGTQCGTLTYTN